MLRLFKKKLPDCNELFQQFFSPWYPEDERPVVIRGDMYQIAAYEGGSLNFDDLQYMSEEYVRDNMVFINETMVDAAMKDFGHILPIDNINLSLLDAVDKYYDRKKIADLIKASDPADFSNAYLVTVCEFGVVLGQLFRQMEGFDWLYSYPYFHSIIVHKDTGFGFTVFDWAIQKFSESGVEDSYVAKFQAALEYIQSNTAG